MADTEPPLALVTGASRLGAVMASCLVRDGWSVAVTCKDHVDEARTLARNLSSYALKGARARVFSCDLTLPGSAEALWTDVVADCGRIPELVVHSASDWTRDRAETATEEAWFASLRLHAWPLVVFARRLAENGSRPFSLGAPALIAMLDARTSGTTPVEFSYGWGKRSAASAVADLASQFAPHVRVNGLSLGPVLAPEGLSEATWASWVDATPLRRAPEFKEIEESLLFLAHSSSVTGQILYLDAGSHLRHGQNHG